jgi:hypothetical protein
MRAGARTKREGMTKKIGSITRAIMNAADGIGVAFVEGKNRCVDAEYEVNGIPLTIRLTELDELFDAMGVEAVDEEVRHSNPDKGSTLVRSARVVDRWERLQELVHGRAGAEKLKVAVTNKRLAWALYNLQEELGVSAIAEILAAPVPSEG